MKAIIPTAGQGTRLYPHTHTKPKPMVRLAGKPIVGHILENFKPTRIADIVIVVGGPMQNQIVEYVEEHYGESFNLRFVEQERPDGLGHSIFQAASLVKDEPLVIALGDMLFQNGYQTFLEAHDELDDVDGSIGVKPVEEPSHYGIVEYDGQSIRRLVEKPEEPPSNLAISGIYVIEDSAHLFAKLEHLINNEIRGAGDEYQLTDALNLMVEDGATLGAFEVADWYDCGRPATLLEANRILLDSLQTNGTSNRSDTVIIEPVDFGADVEVTESVIGPYVSVDRGATITGSIVRNSIVGQYAQLRDVNLEESIIGIDTEVVGKINNLNIGDNSKITL